MSSPGMNFALNNPIISAYVTGLQLRKQQEQQQFQNEYAQNQAKTQQDQFKQQQALHQQVQDYYEKHLDQETAMQQQQLQAENEQHKLSAIQAMAPLIAQGLIKPGQQIQPNPQAGTQSAPYGSYASLGLPNANPSGQIEQQPQSNMQGMSQMLANPQPGLQSPAVTTQSPQTLNASQTQSQPVPQGMSYGGQNYSFATPEDMLARQKALNDEAVRTAGAKAGAEASAETPEVLKRAKAASDAAQTNALALEAARAKNEMDRTHSQNSSAQTIEAMRANASKDVARINAFAGMQPDDFVGLQQQIANGLTKMPSGKLGTMLNLHLSSAGQVPVDPKTIDKLNSLHALDTMTGHLENYVQSLPNDRASALLNSARALLPGPQKAQQDMINGEMPIALKQIEQVGRFNKDEVGVVGKGIGDVRSANTQPEARAKLESFKQQLRDKATKEILGNVPQDQRTRILVQNGFNPDGSSVSPSDLPKGNGQPIDSATAQKYYQMSGGDPARARQLATANGWKVQ